MSSTRSAALENGSYEPSVLIDPCVLLDELGMWATARIRGRFVTEVDLFLPMRRSGRKLEVGHGAQAMRELGRDGKGRILASLDTALTNPLKLVVDPRRGDGGESILDSHGAPRQTAVGAIAAIMNADSYSIADYAVQFSILQPRHDRLALGAAGIFGARAMNLFLRETHRPFNAVGGLIKSVPSIKWDGSDSLQGVPRIARYVRSARVDAQGHNTISAQHRRIDRFLKERGLESMCSFEDEGCRAVGSGRTGFEALLRVAEAGRVDVIVVTSADRLFRSDALLTQFLARMRIKGVTVLFSDTRQVFGNLRLPNRVEKRQRLKR